jgi:uncharacterized membrane protein YeaQ/YmgE (transglycosylase-associated protein family)
MVWTLIIGLAVGAIAKLLIPGKDPGGIFITMFLGVAGSYAATFIGQRMGNYAPNEPAGVFSSVVGAVVLLLIYRLVISRKQKTV